MLCMNILLFHSMNYCICVRRCESCICIYVHTCVWSIIMLVTMDLNLKYKLDWINTHSNTSLWSRGICTKHQHSFITIWWIYINPVYFKHLLTLLRVVYLQYVAVNIVFCIQVECLYCSIQTLECGQSSQHMNFYANNTDLTSTTSFLY